MVDTHNGIGPDGILNAIADIIVPAVHGRFQHDGAAIGATGKRQLCDAVERIDLQRRASLGSRDQARTFISRAGQNPNLHIGAGTSDRLIAVVDHLHFQCYVISQIGEVVAGSQIARRLGHGQRAGRNALRSATDINTGHSTHLALIAGIGHRASHACYTSLVDCVQVESGTTRVGAQHNGTTG